MFKQGDTVRLDMKKVISLTASARAAVQIFIGKTMKIEEVSSCADCDDEDMQENCPGVLVISERDECPFYRTKNGGFVNVFTRCQKFDKHRRLLNET